VGTTTRKLFGYLYGLCEAGSENEMLRDCRSAKKFQFIEIACFMRAPPPTLPYLRHTDEEPGRLSSKHGGV
jgi:hypothetical protein